MKSIKFKRLVTKKVKKYLDIFGGVILIGPRFVGKTTLAKQLSKEYFSLSNGQLSEQFRMQPSYFLNQNQKPIAIDEWQIVPEVLPVAKAIIDEECVKGLVILTGSIWLNYRNVTDPGIGRFGIVKLWPMSLYESNQSEEQISLMDLFNHQEFTTKLLKTPFNLKTLAEAICRGGFPSVFIHEDYLEQNQQHIENLIYFIRRYSDVNLKELMMENLIFQCAVSDSEIVNWEEMWRKFEEKIGDIRKQKFLELKSWLQAIFLINMCSAYTTNLSSNKRIVKADKMYFCDPCLAIAASNLNEQDLIKNLNIFGAFFENLVYRDLKNYAEDYNAQLFYYRDDGCEVDFIMQFKGGKYFAIEVKLGFEEDIILKAAKNLIRYKKSCETEMNRMSESERKWNFGREWLPDKLIVITGLGQLAYKKVVDEEEIYVIPIKALKPWTFHHKKSSLEIKTRFFFIKSLSTTAIFRMFLFN